MDDRNFQLVLKNERIQLIIIHIENRFFSRYILKITREFKKYFIQKFYHRNTSILSQK